MNNKNQISNLPSPSVGGLSIYLAQIKKFPMLDAEEEYMLAKNWRENGNLKSAHKLVTSHLRLVAKIAMGYRGYGLPVNELISEGNLGLMQAVKKFDPNKGFRLATYAMWWIKAAIQEYVLRSWSLVKMGTTTAQKKLFFNLKKIKNQIAPGQDGDLKDEQINEISKRLDVNSNEVVNKLNETFNKIDINQKILLVGSRRNRSIFDIFFTNFMSYIVWIFTKVYVADINGQPKLFNKDLLDELNKPPDNFNLDLYLVLKASKLKYKIVRMDINFKNRIFESAKGGGTFLGKIKLSLAVLKYLFNIKFYDKN